jgi:hypothetical protein
MIDKLAPETQQRLRALCTQMAVAQRLGDDIQRELYGHMEDKLLAYLNGEETVTEEDAFILMREHFGDPAIVKGLLQAAHPMAAGSHFLRRAVAVMCAYTVLMALANRLIMRDISYLSEVVTSPAGTVFIYCFLHSLLMLPALFLLWVTLRFWQRQIDRGRPVWFLEYPGWVLLMLFLGVHLGVRWVDAALPMAYIPPPAPGHDLGAMMSRYHILMRLVSVGNATCFCLLCVWWCDRPPRLGASIFAACGLWTLFLFGKAVLLPMAMTVWIWATVLVATHQSFPKLNMNEAWVRDAFLVYAASGLCAWVIYAALRRTARRMTMTS